MSNKHFTLPIFSIKINFSSSIVYSTVKRGSRMIGCSKFRVAILVLLAIVTQFTIPTGAQTLAEFIEDTVTNNFMPKSRATGLGISVTNGDGSVLYSNGFGFRDVEANLLANNKSLFAIGSITKSFNALLIVKLLSEKFPDLGESVMNMPIQKLAPTLNFTLSDRYRTETASFVDLLSHRSCLTDHLTGVVFGAVKTFDEYVYRSRYESEVCQFRAEAAYSNSMVVLAGDLLAKIMGDSYENLMHKFLNDLDMTDSRLASLEEDYDTLDNMVQGYYEDAEGTLTRGNSKIFRQVTCENPSGGLLSTPDDMAKFMSFVLNKGRTLDGQQLVPEEVIDWTLRPSTPLDVGNSLGMAFQLEYIPGQDPLMSHGGHWAPYTSWNVIFPGLNIGVFSSTNGPGHMTPYTAQFELHDQILEFIAQGRGDLNRKELEVIQNREPRQFAVHNKMDFQNRGNSIQNHLKMFAKAGTVDATCTDSDITGSFGNALDGEFLIVPENGQLLIKYGLWGEGNLTRVGTDGCLFKIEWTSDILIFVYSGMDGGVVANNLLFEQTQVDGIWDSAIFEIGEGEGVPYQRDLTVGNLPLVPYDPNSCLAENYYG